MEVVKALTNPTISRLRNTWKVSFQMIYCHFFCILVLILKSNFFFKSLPAEDKRKWDQLVDLMNPDGDFGVYRGVVHLLQDKKTNFIPCFRTTKNCFLAWNSCSVWIVIMLDELENVTKKFDGHRVTGVNYEKVSRDFNFLFECL